LKKKFFFSKIETLRLQVNEKDLCIPYYCLLFFNQKISLAVKS